MVQLPDVPESAAHEAVVVNSVSMIMNCWISVPGASWSAGAPMWSIAPTGRLVGKPAHSGWQPDWIYVAEMGQQGHWEPTGSGLKRGLASPGHAGRGS